MTATSTPTNRVVATAGHVDHGKSTLIRRLTGIDPDRLEEEKRRGLTIELGFAWCTLPSGREIGFVDVPGHERFVRTMLAGVGPVRLVLFVVAADEGWKPQSEEHLAIVDVLGVDGAVIALTKIDAVDAERLAEVERDVRGRVEATALDDARIVRVSAATGEGVDALVAALDAMLVRAPDPRDLGRPRLFVDRVFSIAGAGTVVTGTLGGGALAVGDAIEIAPHGREARIRGLQSHERPVPIAAPVARVAVNVAGIDRAAIARGDVVASPGRWHATNVLEAHVASVRGLARPLATRGAFTFHAGTAEREARIRRYDTDPSAPEDMFVRIRLSGPIALEVGDRFVLRESGRRETVAGGTVLDVAPPPRPGADASRRLARRRSADPAELPSILVRERDAVRDAEVIALTGGKPSDGLRVGDWWVTDALLDEAAAATTVALATASGTLDLPTVRDAIERSFRSGRRPADRALVDAVIDELVRREVVARDGSSLRAPGEVAGPDTTAVAQVVSIVTAGEPTPPTLSELRRRLDAGTIDAALAAGALVRIGPDLVVSRAFVDRALDVVRAAGDAGATVSAVREALGTSRKFAVPLMEHLDRAGATRREGDLRFARRTDS
ncbi:MAG TPA: selenocysteine-specific translation elongation factor [Actinomycetota bacterium]|nr:selenocysteine-specific translation elongation factor [Actinomycetota bacterium]